MTEAIRQPSPRIEGAASDAAVRSEMYRLLAHSFTFPSAEFFQALISGEYRETVRAMIGAAPFAAHRSELEHALLQLCLSGADFDQFCAEYIRLFEVGAAQGKPPCPLYGGEYTLRPRLDVMEELVRFYSYFDLALSDSDRELPDHVAVELEFMHYLAFREDRALATGLDTSPFRRAQADFIERHPGRWIPLMRERLEAEAPLACFHGLVELAAEILRADLEFLRSAS